MEDLILCSTKQPQLSFVLARAELLQSHAGSYPTRVIFALDLSAVPSSSANRQDALLLFQVTRRFRDFSNTNGKENRNGH